MGNNYIDTTARIARNQWWLSRGFTVSGDRKPEGLSRAVYFIKGLMVNAYKALWSTKTSSLIPAEAMATAQNIASLPRPQEINVSPTGFSYARSTNDTSGPISQVIGPARILIPKTKLHEVVCALADEKPFFTKEEAVRFLEENLGQVYRAPLARVGKLLDELVSDRSIKKTGQFYHFQDTNDLNFDPHRISLARDRIEKNLRRFKDEIDRRIDQLETCDKDESLWNIIHDNRSHLGFRGVYLYQKVNGFKQVHYTSDREPLFKEEAQPQGAMKAVMEGGRVVHRIEIGEDLNSALMGFRAGGIEPVDPQWIEDSLLRYGIGSIDLIKLTNGKGEAVGVLYLRDPVYFGEEQQGEVDNKLAKLGGAIGRAIARLTEKNKIIAAETRLEDKTAEAVSQGRKDKSTDDLLEVLNRRKGKEVRVDDFDRSGRRFDDYTIDKPAQIVGLDQPSLVSKLHSIWDGLSVEFIKKVLLRSTKVKLKLEKIAGEKVAVGYSMVTRKERGTYFEIMAAHEQAQQLGFSTHDTKNYIMEAFIEDASRAMVPKMKWFSRLRFWIKFGWAYLYARGWFPKIVSRPPREFEDIKTCTAFLTDTSVGLAPLFPYIKNVFPRPDFVAGKSFEPSAETLRELLPDGYEPIRIVLNFNNKQIPVYVVRSHEPRQKGKPPKYTKDPQAEKLVREAVSPKTNGLPEGDYDLLVCLEADIHDFRKYYDLNKTGKKVKKPARDILNISSIV